jgi:mono/diheme cytochrome c family protein
VRLLALTLLLLLALAVTGCGSGSSGDTTEAATTTATPTDTGTTGDAAAGKAVFASAGCGGCHTFSAAGSSGSIGPNLDDVAPSYDKVVSQVTNGGGPMPSFKDQLTPQQIQDVAAFVSGS